MGDLTNLTRGELFGGLYQSAVTGRLAGAKEEVVVALGFRETTINHPWNVSATFQMPLGGTPLFTLGWEPAASSDPETSILKVTDVASGTGIQVSLGGEGVSPVVDQFTDVRWKKAVTTLSLTEGVRYLLDTSGRGLRIPSTGVEAVEWRGENIVVFDMVGNVGDGSRKLAVPLRVSRAILNEAVREG